MKGSQEKQDSPVEELEPHGQGSQVFAEVSPKFLGQSTQTGSDNVPINI